MEELIYIFDGTFDGILSCVFSAYENKERPQKIAEEHGLQVSFGQITRKITTDSTKAKRVETGFIKKAGETALEYTVTAFLSCQEAAATQVFNYLMLGFVVGKKIENMLTHPAVLPVFYLNKEVSSEVHLLRGFVRFALLENGIFFARITPKSKAVPLLMPHFVDRYSVQPFIIYDATHSMAGVYDMKGWHMTETTGVLTPILAEGEENWQALWKDFCNAIAIKERINPKLQRSMCPKRYWGNMTEMQPHLKESSHRIERIESGKPILTIDSPL